METALTTTASTFRARFEEAAVRNDSLLCVGLDPDPTKLPAGVSTREFLFSIVDATADLVSCYKPNIAFFEPDLAEGITLLRDLIAHVPDGVPVLLDAKRGDIGHTAEAYARAVFDSLGADAVTLNPYLGRDSLEPFLRRGDRHAFLLCRTSNAGAGDLQDLEVEGHPLYERVAYLANEWNERGNVGLVVGATYPEEAARIREICPDLLFLMPGVGAQAGEVQAAVQAATDARGGGILVNASRGVLYAPPAEGERWVDASRRAAESLRDEINRARAR
ncbi:MAG: orotidine-5'-phosphate decarboxylase [Chloroflexi bacterium]|nr:orotidine-5'-phosphate decarboxylase [Chloroflexota bacterium]MQC47737.1 orotidine-5'-phosphate decarboxylase [Chloroflexota bacterium]